MHSHLPAAVIAVFCCCVSAPAGAQSSQAGTQDVPVIKGNYVLTDAQLCTSKGMNSQITGLASFDTATGKIKLVGYVASGDPVTLTHLKQTLSYSNSATTVTLGDTVYQATYGKLANGIATSLALIAAADPCAAQITLSRQ